MTGVQAKTPSALPNLVLTKGFRKYLKGDGPFPPNAFLGIDVVEIRTCGLSFVPYGSV